MNVRQSGYIFEWMVNHISIAPLSMARWKVYVLTMYTACWPELPLLVLGLWNLSLLNLALCFPLEEYITTNTPLAKGITHWKYLDNGSYVNCPWQRAHRSPPMASSLPAQTMRILMHNVRHTEEASGQGCSWKRSHLRCFSHANFPLLCQGCSLPTVRTTILPCY